MAQRGQRLTSDWPPEASVNCSIAGRNPDVDSPFTTGRTSGKGPLVGHTQPLNGNDRASLSSNGTGVRSGQLASRLDQSF